MFNEKNIDIIERKKEIKEEIKKLKKERNSLKMQDFKTSTIKNLKISLRGLQFVAPYVLSVSIASVTFIGEDIPFYRDRTKKYANVMLDVDSLGNARKYKLEPYGEKFDDDDNKIYYYFKNENNDNEAPLYSVNVSSIGDMSYEDIMKLQEDLEKIYDFDLSESISVSNEPIYNLEYEKLQDKAITRAVIYYEDKEDYVIEKQDKKVNNITSTLFVIDILSAIGLAFLFRRMSSFNFSDCANEIVEEYQPVNKDKITKLTKKLELKKDEYNRLKK